MDQPNTAVIPHVQTEPVARALDWAALSPEERKRRAVAAATSHDAELLVALTDAYLTLQGRSGAYASAHTRRVYATGVRMLVADWRQQNLLHPQRDAALAWLRRLEAQGAWKKDGTVRGATPATVRVRLAAGRALYRALRWAGATAADPFQDARAGAETTPAWEKRQPYSEDDLATLLAAATGSDRLLLLLGAHAGLRVSEICALTWEDVDLCTGTLRVRAGKGSKQRRVSASSSLIAALQERQLQDAATAVIDLTASGARKRMRLLCARAGVPYRGLHALRHYAGTRLVREGGTLEDAARHLGHSNLETARIYAKWADENLKRQVRSW
jgi:integrase/recombinase XerC